MLLRRLLSSKALSPSSAAAAARQTIERVIRENDIVVFMKGTASSPQCGYSKTVCNVLNLNNVSKYTTVNVLDDSDIRAEVKSYTNWPTIPQVFVKGEFVGGCDIIVEMHKNGQLAGLLQKHSIIVKS